MPATPPMPFIDDGYTRDEIITAARWHPEVRIVYRPMLAPERRRLTLQTVRLNARGEGGIDAASQLVIAAVAAKLVSWDLLDAAGALSEICPATVGALEPNLFEKLYSAVAGFDDPTSDDSDPHSSRLTPQASAACGAEEANAKN